MKKVAILGTGSLVYSMNKLDIAEQIQRNLSMILGK